MVAVFLALLALAKTI